MKPDYRRIAQLEYELGFTDEPPKSPITDEPGAIICYHGKPPAAANANAVLKQAWMVERLIKAQAFD